MSQPLTISRNSAEAGRLATLHLASLLTDVFAINTLANGGSSFTIQTPKPFDAQISSVLLKKARYRASLSEHLAFWVRLADAANTNTYAPFAMAAPNTQPEDKGHDGLIFSNGSTPAFELQTVKNSIRDPKPLVASGHFRKHGKPRKGALDDIWRIANQNTGYSRLHGMAVATSTALNPSLGSALKSLLTAELGFNVVAVADSSHDRPDLFDGYHHINADVLRRTGTYIGADSWPRTSEFVRSALRAMLKRKGL